MDFSLKKGCIDRLSSLPNELVCQILSSLPTKDAFVASLSSKKIMSTISSLTRLDFDDSPMSYCVSNNPQFMERFQLFKKFVDNVLQPSQSPHLTEFIIALQHDYGEDCVPDMESTHINSWISFPLSRCGVEKIDLRIHLRNPGKLPSALFACETLDALKLDTNLDFELISSMPSFRFPNLKVLQLHSIVIPEDELVGRLVSNCPLLEELSLNCQWNHGKSVTISSPSLQKLTLFPCRDYFSDRPGDFVTIDTPNLKCFEYEDLLAVDYCMTSMKAPVKALIYLFCTWLSGEEGFWSMVCLVRAICNVQHLCLLGPSLEVLGHDDLSNQMPVFHNLTHLELDHRTDSKWDTVLFEFLMHSPILETLEFPNGIDRRYVFPTGRPLDRAEQDQWVFRKNLVRRPYCCKPHLKRIIIKHYRGTTSDLELVCFLVEKAPVLEELLVIVSKDDPMAGHNVNRVLVENTMKELPMASSTCLIIVQ